jgi:hypothetical protein
MTRFRSSLLQHGWRLRASSAVLPFRSLIGILAIVIASLLVGCKTAKQTSLTSDEKELLSMKTSSSSNSSSSSFLSILQSYGLHIDSLEITFPFCPPSPSNGGNPAHRDSANALPFRGSSLSLQPLPMVGGAERESHPPNHTEEIASIPNSGTPYNKHGCAKIRLSGVTLNQSVATSATSATASRDTTSQSALSSTEQSYANKVTPTPKSSTFRRWCIVLAIAVIAIIAIAAKLRH